MTQTVVVAVIQRAFGEDREENRQATVAAVAEAVAAGADVVVPPELFEGRYFPQCEDQEYFSWATTPEENPAIAAVVKATAGTGAVVPVSFFEAARPAYFNSVAVVADGEVLGLYRKAHIPDGPGYEEKFYFNPGDTGFKTWPTRHGRIGVGICWDQWFPEAARAMALQGADLLVYPTAIGSEVGSQAGNDTADMWRRAMDGHAVCNHVPLAAANRIGAEGELTFYGSSFVVDHRGRPLAEAGRTGTELLYAEVDLARARADRAGWGLFRDRRPDLYGDLVHLST
ncbi:MAG: carbon-nitrogen hydrolase [Acidimicrobiales bacterium]